MDGWYVVSSDIGLGDKSGKRYVRPCTPPRNTLETVTCEQSEKREGRQTVRQMEKGEG